MEIIDKKLFFALNKEVRTSTSRFPRKIINLDEHYVLRTGSKFTPPSIKSILRHCAEVQRRLREFDSIVYVTNERFDSYSIKKRTHSCLFMGAYAVLYLNWSPKYTMQMITECFGENLCNFCDHNGSEKYRLNILDCFEGMKNGVQKYGWFTLDGVDQLKNGVNMNWVIPNKILAMKDPKKIDSDETVGVDKRYLKELLRYKIDYVVRLNGKDYEDDKKYGLAYPPEELFTDGIRLCDIPMKDGGIPSPRQVDSFLEICTIPESQIAVHCHAGLGRTGTMIACFLIRDYGFTSRQAVAWLNLCRRGSVMGQQHKFLDTFYEDLKDGRLDRENEVPVKDPEFSEWKIMEQNNSTSTKVKEGNEEAEEGEPKIKKWKRDDDLKFGEKRQQDV